MCNTRCCTGCGIRASTKERTYPKGRKPILTNSEAVTAVILWRRQNIGSKKSLYEILEPSLSYNRFVVDNLKRQCPRKIPHAESE